MNDNKPRSQSVVHFAPDDRRTVYAVPVKLVVECTLFVLANDRGHAERCVSLVDLQDYLTFDTDTLSTDGADLLRINDVHTSPIDPQFVDLRQLTADEYPPNKHPDFFGIDR